MSMDTPPVDDFGSDRYDYVEVSNAPPGVIPFGPWVEQLMAVPCEDCRANLFIRYGEPDPAWASRVAGEPHTDGNGHVWFVAVAHDDDCPALRKIER